jgi:hypothetical protein
MSKRSQQPRTPEEIVASSDLTYREKVALLRELSYDARELAVADEEGMGGGVRPDLDRINEALRELGVVYRPTNSKH